MAEVLIDLGEDRRVITLDTLDPPPLLRPLLVVAALLLVTLLAGAAHREPPPAPLVVPARLGDMMYVSADRLFVVEQGGTRTVTAYALPDGHLLTRTPVPVAGAIFNVAQAGSTLLVSYQVEDERTEATVALEPGTGRTLWQRPARYLFASPADGIALLRRSSPQYGNLSWYGVDLATGRERWSLRQPARGLTVETDTHDGFPRMLIIATRAGDIEVRDTRTGRVAGAARVPIESAQRGVDVPVWPKGDLLMVAAPGGTTAYALPALTERWRSDLELTGRWLPTSCGDAICSLSWQGGLWVQDAATGALRWADFRWAYTEQAGAYLLAAAGGGRTQKVSVLDPADGRVLGDFGDWHSIGEAAVDGTVIGVRELTSENVVWYARLDPATRAVHVLGMADRVAGDCQTTRDVLVCRRIDASVGIWSLK